MASSVVSRTWPILWSILVLILVISESNTCARETVVTNYEEIQSASEFNRNFDFGAHRLKRSLLGHSTITRNIKCARGLEADQDGNCLRRYKLVGNGNTFGRRRSRKSRNI